MHWKVFFWIFRGILVNNSYPNFIVNWGLALLTSSLYLHDRKRYLSIISFSSLVCLTHGCWLNILNVSYGFYSVYPPVGTGSCHHLASTFFTLHSAAIICHTFCNLNLPVLLPLCLLDWHYYHTQNASDSVCAHAGFSISRKLGHQLGVLQSNSILTLSTKMAQTPQGKDSVL